MLYWNQLFTRVFPEEDVEMKHRTVNDYFKQQWPRLILFAAFTLGVSFFAPLKNFQLKWLIDSKSKQEALGYMGLVFATTFVSWFFERLSRRSFTKIACGAVEQVRQRILELMSVLDETDAKLISLRFGLEGGMPLSPEETGKRLNLTPDEVVAREANALSKLRSER